MVRQSKRNRNADLPPFAIWLLKSSLPLRQTGTLTQHMAMGKVSTIGLKQADKCMKLAATAYNTSAPLSTGLKKWLKFTKKGVKSDAGSLPSYFSALKAEIWPILSFFRSSFGRTEFQLVN